MAVPKDEEVVSFALVKCVTHLLDVALRILAKGALQLTINVHADLFVQSGRGLYVSLFLKVLQYGIVDVLLARREVIQIDASTIRCAVALTQVIIGSVARPLLTSTGCVSV